MAETITLKVAEVAGGPSCVASEDGDKVYRAIVEAIRRGKRVRLSFEGVEDLTSAFLNAAVGQLYKGDLSEEDIRNHLEQPIDASPNDLVLLRRVVERAKEFFKNPAPFEHGVNSVLGNGDD